MLNRLLVIINVLIIIASCSGNTDNRHWIETLPKPWLLSEAEVTNILPEFHKRFPKFDERLKAINIWRIGTPYEIFKLGEGVPPDTDPIIRLDVSDCTAHVLTSLSFAQSKTWDEARDNIIKIHYKVDESGNQIPTYRSRWHFTSDRILSNPNTVNITADYLPALKLRQTGADSIDLETVEITLNLKEDGTELLDLNWSRKIKLSFIPNAKIDSELLEKLPPVCGIAFVRKDYFKDGLAIAHEGILIDQKYLIHASMNARKTVKIDFLNDYFSDGNTQFDGILIYKFVPVK